MFINCMLLSSQALPERFGSLYTAKILSRHVVSLHIHRVCNFQRLLLFHKNTVAQIKIALASKILVLYIIMLHS